MSARTVRSLLVASGIAGIVVAARLFRLDAIPGEWYGDISTLYEYAEALRHGDLPPTLYVLGVGPLYPAILDAVLPSGPADYLAYKLVGVALSLAGLAALHVLARRLHPDRAFAWLVVLVAGTGSWLLALSRLGDQHPLPFALVAVATALATGLDRQDGRARLRAVACGAAAGAGLYAYGAAFMLPAVVAAFVFDRWRRGRVVRSTALVVAATMVVVAAPLAVAVIAHWADVRGGHFARAAASGPAEVLANVARGLGAFFARGDPNPRVNPNGFPHLDPLSGLALLAGFAWWLRAPRREAGTIVVGAFLAMQLPSFLTAAASVPSAGRTIGAAPFAYLLVAGGLWWAREALERLTSRRAASVALACAAATIVAINLQRIFVDYPAGLPWGNVQVARPIARHLAALPSGTHAYVVDTRWGPNDVPEIKSIRYAVPADRPVDEILSSGLDCARFAALDRPGVLVWRPSLPLPSRALCDCAGALRSEVHASPGGVPIFRSAPLPPRDASPTACPADVAAAFDSPRSVPAAPAPAARTKAEPSELIEAAVGTADGTVRIRHSPIDMGRPADVLDGNDATLMRGARDNPFRLEIALARPVPVAAIELVLGYVPHYEIEATVVDARGGRHAASASLDGVRGVVPRPRLALPAPVADATEVRLTIADVRPPPPEGTHVHVYEVRLR